ncbi:MAG: recombination protein RecR [Candidatus Pacebacteria bacterium]|nr:recombination protein RecR [Candidatus Paceibacterota bacterium]
MDTLQKLASIFERFPGIGPRQAGRFVQHLLKTSPAVRRELADAIQQLSRAVTQCTECQRYHEGERGVCKRCTQARDRTLLMVVASDADADAMERSHTYLGTYFILGGTVTLGASEQQHLRDRELLALLKKRVAETAEIILAFPANPEGDATAAHARSTIEEAFPTLPIHMLGRGLSTGSELEYADAETLRYALQNRT